MKKVFLSFIRSKKLAVGGCLLVSIVLGVIMPLHQAKAFDPIIGGAVVAGSLIVGGYVVQLIAGVTGALMNGAGWLLTFIASGAFSSVPYTNLTMVVGGKTVDTIVGIGWPAVRDLVNMFFVIILALIGLSTALRIEILEGFEAKKTLPKLIIIALLVNFTPLITGLIVDASNIVMNFFLSPLVSDNQLGEIFTNQWALQGEMVKEALPSIWNPMENIKLLAATLFIIFFDIMTTGIMMAFAFLFLLRHVAIWILVILSPLAFVAFILPSTKKIWATWWNQFVQWCLVGIVAAFFLYLSAQMVALVGTGGDIAFCQAKQVADTGNFLVSDINDLFCRTIPFTVVLSFLMIGFFTSVSSGAIGASFAARLGRTVGTQVTRGTAAIAGRAMYGGSVEGLRGGLRGMRRGIAQRRAEDATIRSFYPGLSTRDARQAWRAATGQPPQSRFRELAGAVSGVMGGGATGTRRGIERGVMRGTRPGLVLPFGAGAPPLREQALGAWRGLTGSWKAEWEKGVKAETEIIAKLGDLGKAKEKKK